MKRQMDEIEYDWCARKRLARAILKQKLGGKVVWISHRLVKVPGTTKLRKLKVQGTYINKDRDRRTKAQRKADKRESHKDMRIRQNACGTEYCMMT